MGTFKNGDILLLEDQETWTISVVGGEVLASGLDWAQARLAAEDLAFRSASALYEIYKIADGNSGERSSRTRQVDIENHSSDILLPVAL